MKVFYPDGCEQEWRATLTPWQLRILAAVHRQGRGLRDRTNHGSDRRWMQAGCGTREGSYGTWRRKSRHDRHAHEAVVIRREDYGYRMLGVRRTVVHTLDPATGDLSEVEAWQVVWCEFVSARSSASFPPDSDTARAWAKRRLERGAA